MDLERTQEAIDVGKTYSGLDYTPETRARLDARKRSALEALRRFDPERGAESDAKAHWDAAVPQLMGIPGLQPVDVLGRDDASESYRENIRALLDVMDGKRELKATQRLREWYAKEPERRIEEAREKTGFWRKAFEFVGDALASGSALGSPASIPSPQEAARRVEEKNKIAEGLREQHGVEAAEREERGLLSDSFTAASAILAERLSDYSRDIVLEAARTGEFPDGAIAFIRRHRPEEAEDVLRLTSLLRGVKKEGRILGVPTGFTGGTAFGDALQRGLYEAQEDIVDTVWRNPKKLMSRAAELAVYGSTLDAEGYREAVEEMAIRERAEMAAERPMPEAGGFVEGAWRGVAQNAGFWALQLIGGAMADRAAKLKGTAGAEMRGAATARRLGKAAKEAAEAEIAVDPTYLLSRQKGWEWIAERIDNRAAKALAERAAAYFETVNGKLERANRLFRGARELRAARHAIHADEAAIFIREAYDRMVDEGTDPDTALATSLPIGVANAYIETMDVPLIEGKTLDAAGRKALSVAELLGGKGPAAARAARFARTAAAQMARVWRQESLVEEPLQQAALAEGSALGQAWDAWNEARREGRSGDVSFKEFFLRFAPALDARTAECLAHYDPETRSFRPGARKSLAGEMGEAAAGSGAASVGFGVGAVVGANVARARINAAGDAAWRARYAAAILAERRVEWEKLKASGKVDGDFDDAAYAQAMKVAAAGEIAASADWQSYGPLRVSRYDEATADALAKEGIIRRAIGEAWERHGIPGAGEAGTEEGGGTRERLLQAAVSDARRAWDPAAPARERIAAIMSSAGVDQNAAGVIDDALRVEREAADSSPFLAAVLADTRPAELDEASLREVIPHADPGTLKSLPDGRVSFDVTYLGQTFHVAARVAANFGQEAEDAAIADDSSFRVSYEARNGAGTWATLSPDERRAAFRELAEAATGPGVTVEWTGPDGKPVEIQHDALITLLRGGAGGIGLPSDMRNLRHEGWHAALFRMSMHALGLDPDEKDLSYRAQALGLPPDATPEQVEAAADRRQSALAEALGLPEDADMRAIDEALAAQWETAGRRTPALETLDEGARKGAGWLARLFTAANEYRARTPLDAFFNAVLDADATKLRTAAAQLETAFRPAPKTEAEADGQIEAAQAELADKAAEAREIAARLNGQSPSTPAARDLTPPPDNGESPTVPAVPNVPNVPTVPTVPSPAAGSPEAPAPSPGEGGVQRPRPPRATPDVPAPSAPSADIDALTDMAAEAGRRAAEAEAERDEALRARQETEEADRALRDRLRDLGTEAAALRAEIETLQAEKAEMKARRDANAGTWEARTPTGNVRATGTWAKIPIENVLHSDRDGFAEAGGYQPRGKRSANRNSLAQVQTIATALDPERLGDSTETDRGAPIVRAAAPSVPDGPPRYVVDSGNGRVQAISLAAENKNDPAAFARYEAWARAEAERLGAEDLTGGGDAPFILARVLDPATAEGDARAIAELSNQTATLTRTRAETALDDARKILEGGFAPDYAPDADGYLLDTAASSAFMTRFAESLGPDTPFIDGATGRWEDAGYERARDAMLALAVGIDGAAREVTLSFLARSRELGAEKARNALLASAPDLLAIPQGGEYSLRDDLPRAAAETLGWLAAAKRARAEGIPPPTPGDWTAQGELEGDGALTAATPLQRELTAVLTDPSGERAGKVLRDYARLARENEGPSLFGDKPTSLDLLRAARGLNAPDRLSAASAGGDDGGVRYSLRRRPAPAKTLKAYKLMRLYPDGSLGWLFIDRADRVSLGAWYDADSPDLSVFEGLERGHTYLVGPDGTAMRAELANAKKAPSVTQVNDAALNGQRYFLVDSYADGSLKVANWGINGSGAVAPYALRPGIHATNAPSAAHIGKEKRPDGTRGRYRDADEVWVEVEVAADRDYQAEAEANAAVIKSGPHRGELDKSTAQILHVPTDGHYLYRTNNNADERQDWIIAGAIRPVRILSDGEAERLVREGGFRPDAPRVAPRVDAPRFSVARLPDGGTFVLLDRQNAIDWNDRAAVRDYLAGLVGTGAVSFADNGRVEIGPELPDEYTRSSYARKVFRIMRLRKLRGKAAQHLDELIVASAERAAEPSRHKKREGGVYYRRRVDFGVSGHETNRGYSADLISYVEDGTEYLYDMVNIRDNPSLEPALAAGGHGGYEVLSTYNGSEGSVPEGTPGSVSHPDAEVNAENRFSVSAAEDEAYMAAVRAGDMQTAGRMVREAAKRKGYKIAVFHGTPSGGFSVFKVLPAYVTESKEYADRYQSPSASSIRFGKQITQPETKSLFLDPRRMFDTRRKAVRDRFFDEYAQGGEEWTPVSGMNISLSRRGLPDWTEAESIADYIRSKHLPYDSIVVDEGGYPDLNGNVQDRGISYAVLKGSKLKSADPVTYDDGGNVIPLSQRFNPERDDIRFSVSGLSPEGRRQYGAVVARHTAPDGTMRPGWLKAPNGKPSRLTEFQWVQVRTESFKKWFGDWESLAIRNAIEATPEIALSTPSDGPLAELVAGYRRGDPQSERRIIDWAQGVIPNTVRNAHIGDIETSRGSIRSILHHVRGARSRGPLKVLALERMEEILRGSVLVNEADDGGYHFYNLAHRMTFDGEPYLVRLIVKRDRNGNITYDVEFSRKEKMSNAPATGTGASEKTEATPAHSTTETLPHALYRVNPENVSKVVDENGEPLVVWHKTNADFQAFREGLAYFSGDRRYAQYRGLKNEIAAFLNIRNPLRVSEHEIESARAAADKWTERSRLEGFDGLIYSDADDLRKGTSGWGDDYSQIATFSPDQIKSATGNDGGFSQDPGFLFSAAKASARRLKARLDAGAAAVTAPGASRRIAAALLTPDGAEPGTPRPDGADLQSAHGDPAAQASAIRAQASGLADLRARWTAEVRDAFARASASTARAAEWAAAWAAADESGIGYVTRIAADLASGRQAAGGLPGLRGVSVLTPADAAALFAALRSPFQESFKVVCLDASGKVLRADVVSLGTLDSALVNPREVLRPAIESGAASVVISHNHPSGFTTPSRQDAELTARIKACCAELGVAFKDHIVTDGDTCFSFAEARQIEIPETAADWEILPAADPSVAQVQAPSDARRVLEAAGAGDPSGRAHALVLDVKNRVNAVIRFDPADPSSLFRAPGALTGARVIAQLPGARWFARRPDTAPLRALLRAGDLLGVPVLDVLDGEGESATEHGLTGRIRAEEPRAADGAASVWDTAAPVSYSAATRGFDWRELNVGPEAACGTSLQTLEGGRGGKDARARHAALRGTGDWPAAEALARALAASTEPDEAATGDYLLAKYHGDARAAARTVDRCARRSILDALRAAIDPARPAVLVMPMSNREGPRLNVLPFIFAEWISENLGPDTRVDENLTKADAEHNTGASSDDRAHREFSFAADGVDLSGNPQVILCDDAWTSGQTLASALDALLKARPDADVRGLAAIASGRYGKNVAPTEKQLTNALRKANIPDIETANRLLGFDLQGKATGSELQQYILTGKRGPEGLLERFTPHGSGVVPARGGAQQARGEGDPGRGPQNLRREPGAAGPEEVRYSTALGFDLQGKATGSELQQYILTGHRGPDGLLERFTPHGSGVVPAGGGAQQARGEGDPGRAGQDLRRGAGAAGPGQVRYSTARGNLWDASIPRRFGLTDEQLLTAAAAGRMAAGAKVKPSKIAGSLRAMRPGTLSAADAAAKAQQILAAAKSMADGIRTSVRAGTEATAVYKHLLANAPDLIPGHKKRLDLMARRGVRLGSDTQAWREEIARRQRLTLIRAVEAQSGTPAATVEARYGLDLTGILTRLWRDIPDRPDEARPETPPDPSAATDGATGGTGADGAAPAPAPSRPAPPTDAQATERIREFVRNLAQKSLDEAKRLEAAEEQRRRRHPDGADLQSAPDTDADPDDDATGAPGEELPEPPLDIPPGTNAADAAAARLRAADLTLESPTHLAIFVEELARVEWSRKGGPGASGADVWDNPVALRHLQETARATFDKLARDLTHGAGRELALELSAGLPEQRTYIQTRNLMVRVARALRRQRIKDDASALIGKIDRYLRTAFIKGPDFDPSMLQVKRKVTALAERKARILRKIIHHSSDWAAKEWERMNNELNGIDAAYAKENRAPGADRRRAEILETLPLLADYGGLREKAPGRIADAFDEIRAMNDADGVLALAAQRDERAGAAAAALAAAFENPGREHDLDETPAITRYALGHLGLADLLRDLCRHCKDEKKRAAAEAVIDRLSLRIQHAGDLAATEARQARAELRQALTRIYGTSMRAAVDRLNATDDRFKPFLSGARPTIGRAMQLYVSLIQPQYEGNVRAHGRAGQADAIEALLTPQDMELIAWLSSRYEKGRASLSAVSTRLFGCPVLSETPNYMPVRMRIEASGMEVREGRGWRPFPAALTPRIKNSRDFDTRADILSLYADRAAEQAQWKAHADLGVDLMATFGRSSLREAIARSHGPAADKLLINFLNDILNGKPAVSTAAGGVEKGVDALRGWSSLLALGGNVGVMLKQTTSIPAFGFEIGLASTLRHAATCLTEEGRAAMRAVWESAQRRNRWDTGNTEEVENALRPGADDSKLKKLLRATMITNKLGDVVPALVIGQGIYRDALARGLTSEEAMARTWEIIERTQQSGRMENLAQVQRRSALGRALYQFLSTQRQYLSYEIVAARALAADPRDPARWRQLGNVLLLNHLILPSLYWLFGQLYAAAIGKDPPDDLAAQWVSACLTGPLASLFIVGSTTCGALDAALRGKYRFSPRVMPAADWSARQIQDAARLIAHALDGQTRSFGQFWADIDKWLRDTFAPWRDLMQVWDNRVRDSDSP